MSSSDFPEGQLTSDDFVNGQPKQVGLSNVGSSTTLATSNEPSLEDSFNEQSILTTKQYLWLWVPFLVQIPLWAAFWLIFILARSTRNGSLVFDPTNTLLFVVIAGLGIAIIGNFRRLLDLVFSNAKVVKVEGIYRTETTGWGKSRQTTHTFGNTQVRWSLPGWISYRGVEEGQAYVAYCLPISKIIVSYHRRS